MSEYEEFEDHSFFHRHRDILITTVAVLLCAAVFIAPHLFWKRNTNPRRQDDVTSIVLPPPPPPLPTPRPTATPVPQPTPEEQQAPKMLEQQPVHDEKKPEPAKPKAPDDPAPLGTSIVGPGAGPNLGLGEGLGEGGGFGAGGSGGGGSKYGWYASKVQNALVDAVRSNKNTRRSTMDLLVCIWPDSEGRVTQARIIGSTGNAPVDTALKNEVLIGLKLTEPPPSDMPLPIVIHLRSKLH